MEDGSPHPGPLPSDGRGKAISDIPSSISHKKDASLFHRFTVLPPAVLPLLLVAVSFSWIFRARFAARRLLPAFGTVGRPLSYTLVVKNLTSKPQSHLTLLEDLADPR